MSGDGGWGAEGEGDYEADSAECGAQCGLNVRTMRSPRLTWL